jgi:heme-degrading monooxygenase HmoA
MDPSVAYISLRRNIMTQIKLKSVWVSVFILVFCFLAFQPETTHSQGKVGIARVWEGRTSVAKADAYGRYLIDAGVPQMKSGAGNLGVEVLRRNNPDAVDFMVISYWDSRESIKKVVGEDIERAIALPRDQEFLMAPSTTVRHFQILYSDTSKLGN